MINTALLDTPLATSIFHYSAISIISVLAGLGVGIGQGITSYAAFTAMDRQPANKDEISKSILLALAIIETAAILALIFIMILFFKPLYNPFSSLSELGIASALGLPAFMTGIAASIPAYAAMISMARQPFLSKQISNIMLLTQSVLQTPLIFGFLVSIMINLQLSTTETLSQALKLVSSGLCIGLASIGPAIGLGIFTYRALQGIGKSPNQYGRIVSFTFLSQAIIETPIIFAAIIAFWISQLSITTVSITPSIICLSAAIVMSLGTFGTGISSGKTAASAIYSFALNPNLYAVLSRLSFIVQGIVDTIAIYAFIIAMILLLTGF